MINKSLFVQIAIYFMIPLVVAFIHSIVGLKIVEDFSSAMGGVNMMKYTILTVISLLIVYIAYMIASYNCSKKIIKSATKDRNTD